MNNKKQLLPSKTGETGYFARCLEKINKILLNFYIRGYIIAGYGQMTVNLFDALTKIAPAESVLSEFRESQDTGICAFFPECSKVWRDISVSGAGVEKNRHMENHGERMPCKLILYRFLTPAA